MLWQMKVNHNQSVDRCKLQNEKMARYVVFVVL